MWGHSVGNSVVKYKYIHGSLEGVNKKSYPKTVKTKEDHVTKYVNTYGFSQIDLLIRL